MGLCGRAVASCRRRTSRCRRWGPWRTGGCREPRTPHQATPRPGVGRRPGRKSRGRGRGRGPLPGLCQASLDQLGGHLATHFCVPCQGLPPSPGTAERDTSSPPAEPVLDRAGLGTRPRPRCADAWGNRGSVVHASRFHARPRACEFGPGDASSAPLVTRHPPQPEDRGCVGSGLRLHGCRTWQTGIRVSARCAAR